MLTARLCEYSIEVQIASGDAGWIQSAVESACIGNQQAHIASGNPPGKINWDANIVLGPLPGPDRRFNDDGVAGMYDVARVDARRFKLHLCPTRNGIHIEIDGLDCALPRAIRGEKRAALICLY